MSNAGFILASIFWGISAGVWLRAAHLARGTGPTWPRAMVAALCFVASLLSLAAATAGAR